MKAETIKALRGLKVHTTSLQCMGCGYEHSCGIHGCAIIRKAMEEAEQDAKERDAAVADLESAGLCNFCRHWNSDKCVKRGKCVWEWRGPQEET